MRYGYYSRNDFLVDGIPDWLTIGAGVTLIVMIIGFIAAECLCTRTFDGTLVSKDTAISMSYDEERTYYDAKGNRHTSGSDETIATKTYTLTFYSNGQMRTVKAGESRGRVPYVHSDAAALAALALNDVPPPFYIHPKMKVAYAVKVSGWLIDGKVVDMDVLTAEGPVAAK
jgi:hypothetical protein